MLFTEDKILKEKQEPVKKAAKEEKAKGIVELCCV